jgi:hypothetical protein
MYSGAAAPAAAPPPTATSPVLVGTSCIRSPFVRCGPPPILVASGRIHLEHRMRPIVTGQCAFGLQSRLSYVAYQIEALPQWSINAIEQLGPWPSSAWRLWGSSMIRRSRIEDAKGLHQDLPQYLFLGCA